MPDDLADHPAIEVILDPGEIAHRKAMLSRLRDELAALGIDSVLIGRHRLTLTAHVPSSLSGPVDPELHVLSSGCRCVVVTDGQRYHVADGSAHALGDPAGAAHQIASARSGMASPDAGHVPGRAIGAGERALRQLVNDGLI